MSSTQSAPVDRQLPRGHLLVLNRSFRRTLEAENKSPRTIEAYTDAVRLLATYCQAHGHPVLAGELRREHLQGFIANQLAHWKPATAHSHARGDTRLHRRVDTWRQGGTSSRPGLDHSRGLLPLSEGRDGNPSGTMGSSRRAGLLPGCA